MLSLWRRTRPWVRVWSLVAVLAVAGTGVYWFGFRESAASAADAEPTTQSVAASLNTVEQSVSASGTLTPAVQESVSFEVSGTVTSVDVSAGDTVTEGQQLATVDTLQLNADLLSAKADLVAGQAELSNAQDEADGSATSDAQIAALSAQVDVLQTAYDQAEANMAAATLTAPAAGLLTEVNLEVGDVVTGTGSSSGSASASGASGASGSTGGFAMDSIGGSSASSSSSSSTSAQFVIIGTDAWSVSVSVSESDVALIATGDQVELTGDNLDGTIYGTVAEVGLVSTSSGGVAAFPVTIEITGSPEGLHDGDAVTAAIIYERRANILTVPSNAVTTEDGQSVVTQLDADGEQITVPVTVGETSGDMVEILDGLAEGDEVLITVFAPSAAGGDGESGQQPGGQQMPDFGELPDFGGELPDMSQMPMPGGMPGGGNG